MTLLKKVLRDLVFKSFLLPFWLRKRIPPVEKFDARTILQSCRNVGCKQLVVFPDLSFLNVAETDDQNGRDVSFVIELRGGIR